jgi:carbamoyl-phosphate synthase small subunit
MRSVEDILALLGGAEAAAAQCQVGTEAIRKWRQARTIPAKHWPAILHATGLSLADLPRAAQDPADKDTTMPDQPPEGATAVLVLDDGSVHWGRASARMAGLLQHRHDRLSGGDDRSLLRAQIVTFTFPHIGNVGANPEDLEADNPWALGLHRRAGRDEPATTARCRASTSG